MPETNPDESTGAPAVRLGSQCKDEPAKQPRPAQPEGCASQTAADPAPKQKGKGGLQGPNETTDIFLKRKVYPDAAGVFSFQPKTLDEIKSDCRFVLDTNVLLLPFKVGTSDLEEIGKVYRKLRGENRLFIPGQVAREFGANRPSHLADLAHALLEVKAKFEPAFKRYPLLDGLEEYEALGERWKEIQKSFEDCAKLRDQLVERVRGWYWNDPVSNVYHNLFASDVVVEPDFNEREVRADHAWRIENGIPPGYKDKSKRDNGVGDLLIWRTVLHVGKQEPCKSVVLVSGDEKADWVTKSDNKPLFPRYELVDEFRRASKGQSFHLISFHALLALFGAGEDTIEHVRSEEAQTERRASDRETRKSTAADWLISEVFSPAMFISDTFAGNDPGAIIAVLLGADGGGALTRFRKGLRRADLELDCMPQDVADEVRALQRIENGQVGAISFDDGWEYYRNSDLRAAAKRGWSAVVRRMKPPPFPNAGT